MSAISIILVNWNQRELTLDCLVSLVGAGIHEEQIWVVDNGSSSSMIPEIAQRYPAINTIELAHNIGFTGGCNAGVRAALGRGADQLFLLNNDTIIEPQTLPALKQALSQDPAIAAVSPKVYYHNTQRLIQSVGLTVEPNSATSRMLGSGEEDVGQYDQPAEREALFGCAMLIRRAAWEQVGEFWEPLFSYAEETDWCLRARALNWRLLYVPEGVVWHRTSSSLGAGSPLQIYLMTRNQLYLRQRHREGGWRSWRGLARLVLRQSLVTLRYLRRGQHAQARALLLGSWDYLCHRTGNTRTPDLRLRNSER